MRLRKWTLPVPAFGTCWHPSLQRAHFSSGVLAAAFLPAQFTVNIVLYHISRSEFGHFPLLLSTQAVVRRGEVLAWGRHREARDGNGHEGGGTLFVGCSRARRQGIDAPFRGIRPPEMAGRNREAAHLRSRHILGAQNVAGCRLQKARPPSARKEEGRHLAHVLPQIMGVCAWCKKSTPPVTIPHNPLPRPPHTHTFLR